MDRKKNKARRGRGVSIRSMEYCVAGITLLISVLLLIATYRADRGYNAKDLWGDVV